MTMLYSYQAKDITLTQAIASCTAQVNGAIALLYAPDACLFLKLTNNAFHDAHGTIISDLSSIFEARIFTEYCELRWLNRNHGSGDAALITETKQAITGFSDLEAKEYKTLEQKQKYLLWGEPVLNPKNLQVGWQRVAEARIGKLDIPISEKFTNKEQRVYLKTCEYIDTIDYGNCVVIEERLVSLEVK